MDVRDTIIRLGGATAVARRLSYPRTTVQSWMVKNAIPRWQKPLLTKLAEEKRSAKKEAKA